jgi:tripartite-type tricarboxylate transporter receptor subunit TctC
MKRRIFGAALVAAALAAGPGFAQSGKDFFKGKTMTYIVATSAGGGYDRYGRLISKYLAKQICPAPGTLSAPISFTPPSPTG